MRWRRRDGANGQMVGRSGPGAGASVPASDWSGPDGGAGGPDGASRARAVRLRSASLALAAAAALVPLQAAEAPLVAQEPVGAGADSDPPATGGDPAPATVRIVLLSDTEEPIEGGRIAIRPGGAVGGASPAQPSEPADVPEPSRVPSPSPVASPPAPIAVRELGEGHYASEELAPGVYRIHAAASGYGDAARTVRLRSGEVREVTLRLSRRPLALPEIVAAARSGAEIRPVGRAVDFVSFRARAPGAATLTEWLEGLAGVRVRRSGAGRQLLTVRGSRPEGVLVLLDGVPLNDPLTGVADLTGIPASTLESATLVRGAGPEFGPHALAAVLVLRSARADPASASLGIEAGSHGRRAVDAHLSAAGEPGELSLGLRLEESENDFRFENRLLPGRPTETRRNADTRRAHASLAAAPSAVPLQLRLRIDGLEQGAPGRMGTALFDRARWEEGGLQAAAEVGRGAGTAVASYRRRGRRYLDPRAGREEERVVEELHLRGGVPLRDGWRLSGRLERASVRGHDVSGEAARLSGGAAVSGRIGTGPLHAAPGIALDVVEGSAFWSPFLGLALQPGGGWTLWSRAGRALRPPAFGDQYTSSSPRVRPNPSLLPERVTLDLEAGASWTGADGRTGARLAAYHRRTADPIVWLASAVAVWSPRNLDRLTAEGVEADAFWRPSPGWSLEVAGSRERSRVGFGTNRNPLPYAPDLHGRAAVQRSWEDRALRLELQAVGSRTTSLAGTHRLPGMVLVGLIGRQRLAPGGVPMTVDVRLRNVLDARYELISLVPEPGRSLELRLEIGPLGGAPDGSRPPTGENPNQE